MSSTSIPSEARTSFLLSSILFSVGQEMPVIKMAGNKMPKGKATSAISDRGKETSGG
jgi:hypothetical protein